MTTVRAPIAYTIAALVGAAGWLGISQLTHRSEAWDSELYFSWFLPSVALVIGGLGFVAPERSWRWAFTPFAAQAVVATVQSSDANLLPLGLMVFAVYGALCLIPAKLGAALRRRLDRSQPSS
jgi:peptidoglycan/LPS O-acetylase OafA/YrhL